jgi:hypothetical protein
LPALDDMFVSGHPRHPFPAFHNELMEVKPQCNDVSIKMIQCDSKLRTEMSLLLLMTAMGCRIPDPGWRCEQISENEELVDFALRVGPDNCIAMLNDLFVKDCPIAVDPGIRPWRQGKLSKVAERRPRQRVTSQSGRTGNSRSTREEVTTPCSELPRRRPRRPGTCGRSPWRTESASAPSSCTMPSRRRMDFHVFPNLCKHWF